MKVFYVFIMTSLLIFSGCSSANNEEQQETYNDNYIVDENVYDLAEYNYNYYVKEMGNVVTETMLDYDNYGNITEINVVFERNRNDNSLYEYDNNQIKSRDFIYDTYITTTTAYSETVMDRSLRVGQSFINTTQNGIGINCILVEHLSTINTQTVTQRYDLESFDYFDVLHIRCLSTNDITTDSYLVNGWGVVLSIKNEHGVISYSLLDKNSMRIE